jgi:putative chitinase
MKSFFDSVRASFGPLSQPQVDGFNILLKATANLPLKHRAYILATAWHETAFTMQPIAEYGRGKGRPYGAPAGPYGKVYYGRGYVQLTWLANYKKAALATGRDLVAEPDKAMIPEVAADIIVRGMVGGWFTGKKLDDFTDYVDMRAIVNGKDKAVTIAGYAIKFERALASVPVTHPGEVLEKPENANTSNWLTVLIEMLLAIFRSR